MFSNILYKIVLEDMLEGKDSTIEIISGNNSDIRKIVLLFLTEKLCDYKTGAKFFTTF